MRRSRFFSTAAWLLTASGLLGTSAAAPAQVVIAPPILAPAPVVLVPGGNGFNYFRRNLVVSGYYVPGYAGYYPAGSFYGGPYGGIDNRVTIKIYAPTVVVSPPPVVAARDVDLRGVDLDVVGPEALRPGWRPDLAKKPPAAPAKPPEKVDVAKKVEAPAKPPPVAEIPKKENAPPPKKVAEKPAPAEPPRKSQVLTEAGLTAFRAQEYGLAALRFRQACDVEPVQAGPFFLLAQACMALGKYKDAVTAIEEGMRRQGDWPTSAFEPRTDLYMGIEDDWLLHKKHLADAQALHPQEPAYLFLQAYEWWFDGQRDQAILLFERARALAPNNEFIKMFLKAAK
jgi:hypothetical protein